MEKWYQKSGNDNDVVLNTRISLLRNLEEYPFVSRLTKSEREKLNGVIKDIVLSNNVYGLSYIEMGSLGPYQAVSLAERGLITPEFASNSEGRALLLSEDESVGVMLCEEDHIHIRTVSSGLDFDTTYARASDIDSLIDSNEQYAFDSRIGYLTQNPANLGTGMRASVTLHLPALSITGSMPRLASTVSKLGLMLRNCYTNGITPVGQIYRLSNQVTLGISEKAALDNLKSIALQLVSQERQTREHVIKDDRYIDKIQRSYGILKTAHMMSCREFMELVSFVRLGSASGILKTDLQAIDELMIDMQPATINAAENKNFTSNERDVFRAAEIKKKI